MITRRKFIKTLAGGTLGLGLPPLLTPRFSFAEGVNSGKALIVIQQAGGYDFHFGAPFLDARMGTMSDLRGPLAVTDNIRPLNSALGLHSLWDPIYPLHNSLQNLKLISKVGFPCHSRSHFNAQNHFGLLECEAVGTGWMRKLMSVHRELEMLDVWGFNTGRATEFSSSSGDNSPIMLLNKISEFEYMDQPLTASEAQKVRDTARALLAVQDSTRPLHDADVRSTMQAVPAMIEDLRPINNVTVSGNYGESLVGSMLRDSVKILKHKKNTLNTANSVIQIKHGGYDQHNKLIESLTSLLGELSQALAGASYDLQQSGLWNDVVFMVVSEFGRTTRANGANAEYSGTDHGMALMPMLLGGLINGGSNVVTGDLPSDSELRDSRNFILPNLDPRNLFREVFDWMGFDSAAVLGSGYNQLDLNIFR